MLAMSNEQRKRMVRDARVRVHASLVSGVAHVIGPVGDLRRAAVAVGTEHVADGAGAIWYGVLPKEPAEAVVGSRFREQLGVDRRAGTQGRANGVAVGLEDAYRRYFHARRIHAGMGRVAGQEQQGGERSEAVHARRVPQPAGPKG